MCFFVSLVPATFWAVIGYFVLFSSMKADGGMKKFGQILAIWTLLIAVFLPIAGAYLTLSGLCPIDAMIGTMLSDRP